MRQATLFLGLLSGTVLAWSVEPAEKPAPCQVLVLPGAKGPCRIRLEVLIDGRSPETAWDRFLDRLFDWFDQDGNGSLSEAEVRRMFPLPLPGRKELVIDFARLDTNGDGKASLAEFKEFCRRGGFVPVVVQVAAPSADDFRLAELFLRRLDSNGDGKLSRAELRQAAESLRGCDLNDDEFLDLAELLASAPPGTRSAKTEVALEEAATETDVVLRLDFGARTPSVALRGRDSKPFRLVSPPGPDALGRLHGPNGRWMLGLRTSRNLPDMKAAGEFLLAQFKTALGDRAALPRSEIEDDPASSGLQELVRYADRNGDDRLTLAELRDYLALIEQGAQSQVWVRVQDHGRNPFPMLDSDGDQRWSYRELTRACDVLGTEKPEPSELPLQLELTFEGPSVRMWGGVPVPAAARKPRPRTAGPSGPPWFQAMDRNGDGVLSPREFLGPPEVFRKLDSNGDGVITPDEAARAEKR
jgi:Ca2+-binding EF-hand superfamily protein